MRIAVMAAGAVGGYFGARLAAAGHDVVFFARGAHRDAIRRNGLSIESALGDLHLKDVNVIDNSVGVAPVDLVFFAVKLWDTERAAEQLRPLLKPDTRVITLQNGIDSVERLTPILGDGRGDRRLHLPGDGDRRAGRDPPHQSVRARAVRARRRARRSGARPPCRGDAGGRDRRDAVRQHATDLWKKFVMLSGTSSMTSSTRSPIGPIRTDPELRAFFFKLMDEAVAVGKAAGVAFPPDFLAELERAVEAFPPTMKASMAHDLERGNRLELDWLAGKVVALGRSLGVPTPANEAMYAVLKLHRMGSA